METKEALIAALMQKRAEQLRLSFSRNSLTGRPTIIKTHDPSMDGADMLRKDVLEVAAYYQAKVYFLPMPNFAVTEAEIVTIT